MEKEKITSLKQQVYSQEMIQLMKKERTITKAVFNKEENLQIIAENQVEAIMGMVSQNAPDKIRAEIKSTIQEIKSDLMAWESEDMETRIVNQAARITEAALVDPVTTQLYIAIAELQPRQLKSHSMKWCQEEAIRFIKIQESLMEKMPDIQAKSIVSEMIIDEVTNL